MQSVLTLDHDESAGNSLQRVFLEIANEFFESLLKKTIEETERLLYNILPVPDVAVAVLEMLSAFNALRERKIRAGKPTIGRPGAGLTPVS